MFSSKSPVLKIVGYILIGFFLLIIIIAFGMPDFITPMGRNPQILAKVNGKPVYAQDFLRFRNIATGGRVTDNSMDQMLMTNYIVDQLMLEKASNLGFTPTKATTLMQIRSLPELIDERTGAYSPALLESLLQQNNWNYSQFFNVMREYMTRETLRDFIHQGITVSTNEVEALHAASGTKTTVAYSLLTSNDIRQRYAASLNITDEAVEEQLRSDRRERQDPETDRARVRANLERAKYLEVEDDIVSRINDLVESNANFNTVFNTLRGKSGVSKSFGLGEPIVDDTKEAMPLAFASSRIFTDNFMKMQIGEPSKAIKTPEGIYVFTIIRRETPRSLTRMEIEEDRELLYDETSRAVFDSISRKLLEDAKIEIFLGN